MSKPCTCVLAKMSVAITQCVLIVSFSSLLSAQTVSDSLVTSDLPPTTVTAFGQPGTDRQPVATIKVNKEELRRYDESSLVATLNRLPGVRFEERATASYRVAIRGASLRSPFGVRNTQVYWNGLPYGEPGGDVPLNFLDASNIDGVEVLRGPTGGFYGPGTAGTLLLNTQALKPRPNHSTNAAASLTAGSYGYLRGDLQVSKTGKERRHDVRLGFQSTDGYRDHSSMDRINAQYSGYLDGKGKTALHALYTDLSYDLPGGLNAEQFAENPRQARPGSEETDASINYRNILLGLTDQRALGTWRLESALYATGFYFDHPFNFDYKREINLGTGGRLALRRLLRDDLDLTLGTEIRLQRRFANNYTNPDGGRRPGALNFSDELLGLEQLYFGQLRYQPGPWDFTVGLSNNQLRYTVDRTFNTDGETGLTEFNSDRPVSLRLAAGYRFGDGQYVYASRADGFSPPTLDEFRTNEGSLNVELNPEIGTNYEIGYRASPGKWRLDATAFYFRLDEAINGFADERGTQLFRNAGSTTQLGAELAVQYATDLPVAGWRLWLYGAYTYYDFTYDELERGGEDFSGQRIPGAAPHTTNVEALLTVKDKVTFGLLHNFVDAIPLNDANDVVAESYHLVRATASYRIRRVRFFASVSNLLNERMSFGNDLNPRFGGRYFQPAPGRNFQLGVRFGGNTE